MLSVTVIGNEKVSLKEEDFLKMDAGLRSCQDRWDEIPETMVG